MDLPLAVLRGYIPLGILSDERLKALMEQCQHRYVRKGKLLFDAQRLQNQACFILSGSVLCQQTNEHFDATYRKPLRSYLDRRATFSALTDCSLFYVDLEGLDRMLCWSESAHYLESEIMLQKGYADEQEWVLTILHSNLFYKVSPLNLKRVFVHLVPERVKQGQVIIRQGDIGDCCYILREGEARVTRRLPDSGEDVTLADVGYGRCFGEDALIHEAVRNATITMLTDGLLMRMDKRDFVQLLKEPPVDMLPMRDLDLVLKSGARLLDVRGIEEFDEGHLPGAQSMPLGSLYQLKNLLDDYTRYVVYCDTGRRSRVAASLMSELGFSVMALQGGLAYLPQDYALTDA